jgi:hypothetical protein
LHQADFDYLKSEAEAAKRKKHHQPQVGLILEGREKRVERQQRALEKTKRQVKKLLINSTDLYTGERKRRSGRRHP